MPRKTKRPVSSELYSVAAEWGIFSAWGTAIALTITGIIMIVIGSTKINKKTKLDNTEGIILSSPLSTCSQVPEITPPLYNCTLVVKYYVNGQSYLTPPSVLESNINYSQGGKIQVYYDPKTPGISQLNPDAKEDNTIGIVLIVCGVIFPILAWIWLYVARKSTSAAALGGFFEIVDGIRKWDIIF